MPSGVEAADWRGGHDVVDSSELPARQGEPTSPGQVIRADHLLAGRVRLALRHGGAIVTGVQGPLRPILPTSRPPAVTRDALHPSAIHPAV
jgi:hypothetical protein